AGDLDAGREPDLPVVRPRAALDDAQQARLARAVAADEPDVLAGLHHEVGVVEQGYVSVRERDFRELEKRHDRSIDERGQSRLCNATKSTLTPFISVDWLVMENEKIKVRTEAGQILDVV